MTPAASRLASIRLYSKMDISCPCIQLLSVVTKTHNRHRPVNCLSLAIDMTVAAPPE